MRILPAIDLKDGKCVRLFKGDFSTVHQVSEDPVETAKIFEAAGAQLIHMVDLDGALDGKRKNGELVKNVAKSTSARIELGGGIRNMDDIRAADELGVWRFIIGSAAVSDPEFVAEAVKEYGERIAVGIDALRTGHIGIGTGGTQGCATLGTEEPIESQNNDKHNRHQNRQGVVQ